MVLKTGRAAEKPANLGLIRGLTFLMFAMFAMTTDSVGAIIPEIIRQFHLSLTAAGAFQYATMGGIAASAVLLGFVADRLGRKAAILIGLTAFAIVGFAFPFARQFSTLLGLLFVSGVAIGLFKTGALALVGEISTTARQHTTTMNLIEGFFGAGAIIGPAAVAYLIGAGVSWKWLYVIAGGLCVGLIVMALRVRYPARAETGRTHRPSLGRTLAIMGDPFALGFGLAIALYVGVETAIYVWMPTLLGGYRGPAIGLVPYALSIFFVLRAAGRFLGAWALGRLKWSLVLAICGGVILLLFAMASLGGPVVALYALPTTGLFMSVMYPTLNSKGISCFARPEHGSVSGVILFFTCVSAVVSPLLMGLISDAFGGATAGFQLATGFAAALAALLAFNALADPSRTRLAEPEA